MSKKAGTQLICDDQKVSKEGLDTSDIHSIMRAVEVVKHNIVQIAAVLKLEGNRIKVLQRQHENNPNRLAISLVDTWLRGNYTKDKPPYNLHEEKQFRCPSWWNLVWAVESIPGGACRAHAQTIAQEYKNYGKPEDTSAFDLAPTDQIGTDDAYDCINKLYGARTRWYEIGVTLKIPTPDLDAIAINEHDDASHCFTEMITRWLQIDLKTSWKRLLIAVAASHGGEDSALAIRVLDELTPPVPVSGDIKPDDSSAAPRSSGEVLGGHPKEQPDIDVVRGKRVVATTKSHDQES